MRKPLIVLLGLGVLAGYGSAFASFHHRRWHGGYEGGCDRGWSQRYQAPAPVVTAPAPAPAPVQQPQQVVPQIIIVQPQAAVPAQVIVTPPAPEPKKAEQPQAKPQAQE